MAELNDVAIDETVDQMLDELMQEAERAADVPLSGDVKLWWTSHYRAKFYYALRRKGKNYSADKAELSAKARELGLAARKLAVIEPISTFHAAIASYQVDCKPISVLEGYCN